MVLFSSSTSRSSLSATASRVAASSSARVAVLSSTVAAVVVVAVVVSSAGVSEPPLEELSPPQAVMLRVRVRAEIPASVFLKFFIFTSCFIFDKTKIFLKFCFTAT